MDKWRNSPDARPPQDVHPLARVWRVTQRDVDEYTQLILAADRVGATNAEGQVVSNLDRRNFHEVVSCVELTDQAEELPA